MLSLANASLVSSSLRAVVESLKYWAALSLTGRFFEVYFCISKLHYSLHEIK